MSSPRPVDPEGYPQLASMASAVVHEGLAYLSGVVAMDAEGKLIGEADPKAQAKACIDHIERTLAACGATLQDIIRATCFATSQEAALAYMAERAARAKQRPAATTVQVAALLLPGAMLEVEVIARVPPTR